MIAIQCLTHYSVGEAFAKPEELAKRGQELKLNGIVLADLHSLSGSVEFYQSIEKVNKKSEHKIKPIFGMTVDIKYPDKEELLRVILISKNLQGWHDLIKITSIINTDEKHRKHVKADEIAPLFGKNNLFIINQEECIPSYYAHPDDKLYHQIMLCVKLKKTLDEAKKMEGPYAHFFHEDIEYSLKSSDPKFNHILDQIESYSILRKPVIPKFIVPPEYKDSADMLYQLCREGWINKNLNLKTQNNPQLKEIYVNRVKEELNILIENQLSDYMLIIRDFIQFCRQNNQKCGLRGSSVGCLVSYLIDISHIDPVQPDPTLPYAQERELLFSRFYNAARKDSLPDIDFDVPMSFRDKLISFIKDKYGENNIASIITFSRMDGRGALKEVFRILNPVANSFAVANEITSKMVETTKVQDILEEYKEDDPNYSVIDYCIEHIPAITEYSQEFPREFEIAKKLASTIRASGIHAAGIVISNTDISNLFPIDYSKDGIKLVSFEMADLEATGGCKYDILSLAAYEKLGVVEYMVKHGLDEVPILENGEILDESSL